MAKTAFVFDADARRRIAAAVEFVEKLTRDLAPGPRRDRRPRGIALRHGAVKTTWSSGNSVEVYPCKADGSQTQDQTEGTLVTVYIYSPRDEAGPDAITLEGGDVIDYLAFGDHKGILVSPAVAGPAGDTGPAGETGPTYDPGTGEGIETRNAGALVVDNIDGINAIQGVEFVDPGGGSKLVKIRAKIDGESIRYDGNVIYACIVGI